MAKTKLHDIEICVEDNQIKIHAYKLDSKISVDGYLTGDYSDSGHSATFICELGHELTNYILDTPDYTLRGDWEEYSEWDTSERFFRYDKPIPEAIEQWLEALPEYEVNW